MKRVSVFLLCAFMLAACGSSGNKGIASANGGQPNAAPSTRDDPVAFVHCMRDHGQTMTDPTETEPWGFDPHPRNPPAGWAVALQACMSYMPEMAGLDAGPSAQELEQLRAFAVCMRAHDIPITDPQIGGDRPGNMQIGGRFENVTRAQLEADPTYKAAIEACKDKLPVDSKGGK